MGDSWPPPPPSTPPPPPPPDAPPPAGPESIPGFDASITDVPYITDSPDNGPAVNPAPLGPKPVGLYEYIYVPLPCPFWPDERNGVVEGLGPYWQIESEFFSKQARADRLDRIDGSRVYRVPIQLLWRFDHDQAGPVIGRPPLKQYRFLLTDPTAALAPKPGSYWTPVF